MLLLSGDAPLVTRASLERLVAVRRDRGASLVVATADLADPSGYGRVVRHEGELVRIVEDRDADAGGACDHRDQQRHLRVLSGLPFRRARQAGHHATRRASTTCPSWSTSTARLDGSCSPSGSADPDEIRGINTRAELALVGRLLQQRINEALMSSGVTLVDPAAAYIGPDVAIGTDTVVQPGVFLEGRTVIGPECEIHAGTRIVDSTLGSRVTVFNHTVITGSEIARRLTYWAVCQNSSIYNTWSTDHTSVTSSRSRNPQSVRALKLVICPMLAMPRSVRA